MPIDTACWVIEQNKSEAPLFRRTFALPAYQSATLELSALGYGEAYLNGKRVSDHLFAPAVSNYSRIDGRRLLYPLQDEFARTRVYYTRYDVTHLLQVGENLLSVHCGNGFFNQKRRTVEGDFALGAPRIRYALQITLQDGSVMTVQSDENTLAQDSYVLENNLFYGELHDLSRREGIHAIDYDQSNMTPAQVVSFFECDTLTLADYPPDRIQKILIPRLLGRVNGKDIYDVGENTTGWIVFDTDSANEIVMEFAEELYPDGSLDFSFTGETEQIQSMRYLGDGKPHQEVHPLFSWQGFRYFSVVGEIKNPRCAVIHTDLPQNADFTCENDDINTLLASYIRTQKCNLHGSIPSDCPHRERLGYTGDGQITCETVMQFFDARALYRKWMRDITDCQNRKNGHIQHTAPLFGGGGGPGGWGGAVIILPYQYYQIYADACLVTEHLAAMQQYLSYMESRCADGLVVCEEKDGWCLGDWCFEGCGKDASLLPEPYVNTYYLIKCYDHMLELHQQLSLSLDEADYRQKRALHADAIMRHYAKPNGDFCSGKVGANAFALDIGLGDARTYDNLIAYYTQMGGFDSGIFATEILLRLLAAHKEQALLYKLLTSKAPKRSFGDMFQNGLTTLSENWDTSYGSHNHPMFGGGLKAIFTGFLGVQRKDVGYRQVEITPINQPGLGNFSGYLTTPYGKISERLIRTDGRIQITVTLPKGINGDLCFAGERYPLLSGENCFSFDQPSV